MPFIIDARNMGGGSIGSAAGGDTSTGTRNNVTLAAPWDESKEYLKGDLATNNGDLYQAQKSVPAGVQISDEDYWALVVVGDKSKETEQLRKDIGSLAELETESKDNLVNAINEVGSIQPDWNQNDETKKDYIKGRTHYTYKERKTLYENTAMDFTSLNHINIDGNPFLLEEGKTYIVVWDGVEHEAVCKIYPASGLTFLGNVYWDNKRPSDDTGEPFYVDDKAIYGELGSGTHSILLMQNVEAVHTLDPKYIEDMYYTKTKKAEVSSFVIGNDTNYAAVALNKPLVFGHKYIWTDSYSAPETREALCTALSDGNLCISFSTSPDSAGGSVFALPNSLLGHYNGPSNRVIKIVEVDAEEIHQIDNKYIADMYGTETTDGQTVTITRSTDDGSDVYIGQWSGLTTYYWRSSDKIASKEELATATLSGSMIAPNDTYIVISPNDSLCYLATIDSRNGLVYEWTENTNATNHPPVVVVYKAPVTYNKLTFSKVGVYLLCGSYSGGTIGVDTLTYTQKVKKINKIDEKYIPNQNTVFEARLFRHPSVPYQLILESGIVIGDLVKAFDEGQRVIARLCDDENDNGFPFEMQGYVPGSSSGIPNMIMFAPCSVSFLQSGGAIDTMSTAVIEFADGNWYLSGFALDAIGGQPGFAYTIPFEINAESCNTFAELVSATQNFRWRAYIYKGNHKLYLQIPEYSSSVTPSVLQFAGITTHISQCVWTTVQIEVSPSNVIRWDDSTLPTFNDALDTWGYYKLNKDSSGVLRVYDVFNEQVDNLGVMGRGVIEYQGHQYLFNNVDGASLRYYYIDFNRTSEPKFSTITINRRINDITVTDLQPLWGIATESEVNNAVDDIFKT